MAILVEILQNFDTESPPDWDELTLFIRERYLKIVSEAKNTPVISEKSSF